MYSCEEPLVGLGERDREPVGERGDRGERGDLGERTDRGERERLRPKIREWLAGEGGDCSSPVGRA